MPAATSTCVLPKPAPAGGGTRARRAGPLTLRLVLSLALLPFAPAFAAICSTAIARTAWFNKVQVRGDEETQLWFLLMTLAVIVPSVGVWHRAIAWSARRRAATALAVAVTIVHVLYWHPIWAQRFFSQFLTMAQCTAMVGLWVWITVPVWWRRDGSALHDGRIQMSDSARRVLLSYGLIPFVVGGYFITVMVSFEAGWFGFPPNEVMPLMVNNMFWAVIAVLVWLGIWRSSVVWDGRSVRLTCLAAIGFVLAVGMAPILPTRPQLPGVVRMMLPLVAWGGWMLVTILCWPMRASPARFSTPAGPCCRTCGYSLRGLYATRCPECGDQPTLDELFASAGISGDA